MKFNNVTMPISNFCEDCHTEYLEKGWFKKNHNWRRGSVTSYGPILMKILIFFFFSKFEI